MNSSKRHIFLFAGEQSGDLHGSALLSALQETIAFTEFYGVGGPKMRAQGLNTLIPMEEFQVMGFSDVFKALPKLYRQFQYIKNTLLKKPPEAVIFIDYPGFNMRLAKALRKGGYKGKLIHYICPSVWAWKKGRIQELIRTLDLLITIYPFENKYFENSSLQTIFIGHPLVNIIDHHTYDLQFLTRFPQFRSRKCVALFPGSRHQEIIANLPLQLKTAVMIQKKDPSFFFALSIARPELISLIKKKINLFPELKDHTLLLPEQFTYDLMKNASIAIATSGTITLELALHGVPTVVHYLLTPLNYFIAKYLFRIRLPHYCIVNILAQTEIFPEIFHHRIAPLQLFQCAFSIIDQQERYRSIQHACMQIKKSLYHINSSQLAAIKIKYTIDNKQLLL